MTALLHALESIHVNLIVIGLISSCLSALLPGLMLAIVGLVTRPWVRERAVWDRASIDDLLETLDRARDELRAVAARFVAGPDAGRDRETEEVAERTVRDLRIAVDLATLKRLRRPLWQKFVLGLTQHVLMNLLCFLLGAAVALLVIQSR